MYHLFHTLVLAHIAIGSIGLLSFWVPVLAQKGGINHMKWGRVFTWSMLITGSIAFCMSSLTVMAPIETHPHLDGQMTMDVIISVFGWMMQYLAVLTVNLAWYGWLCVLNKRDHLANREWRNIALQYAVMIAAANCAWRGYQVADPMISSLMMGISTVGIATGVTNLWFIYKPAVGRMDWQYEHVKALVGAGISVYTAFFAFGAVRLMPELALNPFLWAVPLVTGLSIILYQWRKLYQRYGRGAVAGT
jgi:hypothetical protein